MTHSALPPRRARTEPLQSRSPANFCIRLGAVSQFQTLNGGRDWKRSFEPHHA